MSLIEKIIIILGVVLVISPGSLGLYCYKGFDPSYNQSSNHGVVEDCRLTENLQRWRISYTCYTRVTLESGENKIYRGCVTDLDTCKDITMCWFCHTDFCNSVGDANTIIFSSFVLLTSIITHLVAWICIK